MAAYKDRVYGAREVVTFL